MVAEGADDGWPEAGANQCVERAEDGNAGGTHLRLQQVLHHAERWAVEQQQNGGRRGQHNRRGGQRIDAEREVIDDRCEEQARHGDPRRPASVALREPVR